ncbi:HIT family protein [Geomonas anaerohicana]|uniref:HIT domain-containing protein n=1 Tax=Geomonas anaerohicana TaxID=2798583 RepID=A0ABS0YAL3_9BACT|nr:HIT domain-containing protein [Geomonas anaerohicana]MBJ6749343.1 HIT domain-containing protein [Geomonas anaerohicana]
MDRLWAPWRVEYLTQPPAPGCIFCAEGDDRELLIIHRTPLARVMLNRYPYCNGHLLISLHRHTAELDELTGAEMQELFRLVALCKDVLVRSSSPDGFNVGMNLGKAAGAGVEDHLHLHVVPRWSGDSNFMSVVADLRVLPEALLATYDRLLPFFPKAEGA